MVSQGSEPVSLSMSPGDFEALIDGPAGGPVPSWIEEDCEKHYEFGSPARGIWSYYYGLDASRASMVLARMFLTACGEPHAIYWNLDDEDPKWFVVTDYAASGYEDLREENVNSGMVTALGLGFAPNMHEPSDSLPVGERRALLLMCEGVPTDLIETNDEAGFTDYAVLRAAVAGEVTSVHVVAIPDEWAVPGNVRQWANVEEYLARDND